MLAASFLNGFLKICCVAGWCKECSWSRCRWKHARACGRIVNHGDSILESIHTRTTVPSLCPSSAGPKTPCPVCCVKHQILPAVEALQSCSKWEDIEQIKSHILTMPAVASTRCERDPRCEGWSNQPYNWATVSICCAVDAAQSASSCMLFRWAGDPSNCDAS